MPHIELVPTGTVGTPQWSYSGGSSLIDSVDEDDDSTYISEVTLNHYVAFVITDPTVAESEIDFDEDVTITPTIHAHHTGTGNANVEVQIIGSPGSSISLPADTISVANNSSFPTYTGTGQTVYAAGSDWTYSELENAGLKLTLKSRLARFQSVRVSYAYLRLSYTEAVTGVTHDAILFGTNF